MTEDLQSLLEKINRDGIEKADAEAARIVAEAKAKAEAIVKAARQEAEGHRAEAEKAAAESASRAAETIRQAARDTIIAVRETVTAMLERLLAKDVNAALADPKVAADLAAKAVEGLVGSGEIAAGEKIAASLKARLAARKDLVVVTDPALETGFSVRVDGGRVEHAFTGDVIAAELAKRLRPDLAALLK